MGQYVNNDWGKRGTYPVSSKEHKDEKTHYYAPGDNHDKLHRNENEYKQFHRESKPKRHWGIRIVLFILLVFVVGKYNKFLPNFTSIGGQSEQNSSRVGVNVNYSLKDYRFLADQSDLTEVAIREYLNLYHIDYSDFYYDSEEGYYVAVLSDNTSYMSEEKVKDKGKELQDSFVTYCSGTGSNYGVQSVSVEYQYTSIR